MPYIKEVFDVVTFEQAKHVVLTSDPSNPKKFENETNFFVDTVIKENVIDENSVVLDFGCGMGRISKRLIESTNCKIIGTDISDSMLTFAKIYVAKPSRFFPCNKHTEINSVDVVIATFVLQHTEKPKEEIENIVNVLKPGGYLILVNEPIRYVPSNVDSNRMIVWNDDGFNVFNELSNKLTKIKSVRYMNSNSDIIFYRKDL